MMIDNESEGPLTLGQLVRRYFPLAGDNEVMFILWEMTPYPCWDPREELERLARVCAPVRKRGWHRKLCAESKRIYDSIDAACRSFSTDDEYIPAADAVDPSADSTGKPSTRD